MLTGSAPYKIYRSLALGVSGNGVNTATLTGAFNMTALDEQFQDLDGGVADRDVVLPTANPELRGVFYIIRNRGTTNSLVVKDVAATVATVNFGEQLLVACNGTNWKMLIQTSGNADLTGSANTWALLQTLTTGALVQDAGALKFGTPGTDVVFTADGTNVVVTGTGLLALADDMTLAFGTGNDDSIAHDGTSTTWTHTTGPLVIHSTDVNDAVIVRVGTDTSATSFQVQGDAETALFKVDGAGAVTSALPLSDELVVATVACANATGGATTALMSIALKQRDNSTAISSARQVLLQVSSVQYNIDAGPGDANLSIGTVTAGSIISTPIAGGMFLVETDATGAFAATVTNTADTTRYFSVRQSPGGYSDLTKRCVVLASNSDSAAWSA